MSIYGGAYFTTIMFFAILILCISALFLALNYRRRLKKIELVINIGKDITSEIKMKKLIYIIIEIAKQQMKAEACSLYLVDERTQELYFSVALGEKEELIKDLKFEINDSFMAGWVAIHNKTLNIRDITKDERFKNRTVAKNIGLVEKAYLTMPIISKGKTIAVLQMINKQGGGYFTKSDEEIMNTIIETQITPSLENSKLYKHMQELFTAFVTTIANVIDARDDYTQGHCVRVSEYSVIIGKYLGMSEEELEDLGYAAVLHDVGKIGIKDSILNSTKPLTRDEYEEMKTHVDMGAKILGKLQEINPQIIYGAKYHHERYDGNGYKEGLAGEDIPLFARIIAVADSFDAMTSDRPYRKGMPLEAALSEISRGAGIQYDRKVADAFVNYFRETKAELQTN